MKNTRNLLRHQGTLLVVRTLAFNGLLAEGVKPRPCIPDRSRGLTLPWVTLALTAGVPLELVQKVMDVATHTAPFKERTEEQLRELGNAPFPKLSRTKPPSAGSK